MLYRLIYLSEARGALDANAVSQILDASRKNNPPDQITGLLLFLERQFFQVLEGPLPKVKATYQRIGKDKRHVGLRIIQSREIRLRAFPNWSMGYIEPSKLNAQAMNSVFALRELVPPNSDHRGEDPEVRRVVRDFMAQFDTLRV